MDEPLFIGEIVWLCMQGERAICIRHTFDDNDVNGGGDDDDVVVDDNSSAA